MYLKAIELAGFKSFAVPTRLEFSRGMAAIVGPNGSGKSNLADAVRWVLGEQSSRSLRGQQMGDLIFAGSSEQRAAGMAEVQLIFDNSDQRLPLPSAEVAVARRIFRDGTSEYLLGGKACRLRDIVELFTDTGLGRANFAIIGQGQIDAILDERPEERRSIFEEAAGIARQRQRKAEAIGRLQKVAEQLLRVRDLQDALQENEAALEKQAIQARRYLELQRQLRQVEFSLYYHDILSLDHRLKSGFQELQQAEEALLSVQNELAVLDADLLLQRESQSRLEAGQQQTSQAIWQSRQDQERYLGEQRLWEQRLEQLAEQEQQQSTEQARLNNEIGGLDKELHSLENSATEYRWQYASLERELSARQQDLAAIEDKLRGFLTEQSRKREEYVMQSRATVRLEAQLEQKQTALAALLDAEQRLQGRDLELCQRQEQLREQLQGAAQTEQQIKEQLARLTESVAANQAQRGEAERELRSYRSRREELWQERTALQTRQRMLREMEEQREGYSRTLQQLLAARDRGVPELAGLIDVLGRVITAPAELELAIEVALGAAAQNMVCSTEQAAELAIAWLKQQKAGRATFLPLDVSLRSSVTRPGIPAQLPGFIGFASDLVQCEERFRAVVERQLGRILVMRDLASALAYARRSGYRERIVTLEGEQLFAGGSLSGGSAPRRDSSLLARPRLLAQAEEELRQLAARLGELDGTIRQAEENLRRITEQEAEQHTRELQLERQLAQAGEQLRLRQREEENLRQAILEQQGEREKIYKERQTLDSERDTLSSLLAAERTERSAWQETEQRLQHEEETLRLEQQRIVAEQSGLQSRLEHATANAGQNAVQLQSVQRRLAESKERLQQITESGTERVRLEQEYRTSMLAAEDQVIAEEEKQIQLQGELQRQGKEHSGVVAVVAEGEQRQTALRRQEERAGRKANENRMQQVRLEDERSYLERRLLEEHQRSPEQLLMEMEQNIGELLGNSAPLDIPATTEEEEGIAAVNREVLYRMIAKKRPEFAQQMQEFRQNLLSLGSVNLMAIEELERLQERLQQLELQTEDLRTASSELQHLIVELEKLMSKQFAQSISEISGAFEALFQQLFRGGEARLILSNPEQPLEGGVEIAVRLPGKKTSSLTLLSGGERALTALALLLAITQIKAPPFCLLDEVETALDEANLERLASLLAKISTDCQIIVITHRRPTMEAAETLIGITMQTKGVSTALAVRLDQVEN